MSQPRGELTFPSVRWSGQLTLWTMKYKFSKRTLSDCKVGSYRPTWRGKKERDFVTYSFYQTSAFFSPQREAPGATPRGPLWGHVAVLRLQTQGEGLFVQVLDSPCVVRLRHTLQLASQTSPTLNYKSSTDLFTYRVSEMSSDTSLSVECSLTWKSPSQEMLLWGRRKAQPSMCKTASSVTARKWRGSSSRRAVTFTCVGECRGLGTVGGVH